MRNTILYIGGFLLPNFNASAIRVIENAWLLRQLGYRVIIIGKLPKLQTEMEYEGFKCFDIIKPFETSDFSLYTKTIDSVTSVVQYIGKENIKAIIAYNYPAFSLDKLATFSRKNGIVPIADITEWYGWEGLRPDRNIRRFIDTQYRMRIAAKQVGNIICAGSYLENFFKELHTVVWPFCVNTDLERWQLSSSLSANKVRTFVYTGSPGIGMSKDKLDLLIEVFWVLKKSGKAFKYIIQGITKKQYLKAFKAHRALLELLGESVEFKGRVPHKEALKTLKNADFSLFTRPDNRVSHAGFPTKVIEAFTFGIPTITNATSDIPKYVKDGINGFIFKSAESEDIKATLLKSLALSDEELLVMKHQCRAYNPFAIENFKKTIGAFIDRAV